MPTLPLTPTGLSKMPCMARMANCGGGVDDGRAEQGAEHAAVADGECASVHIFHSELIFTSLRNTSGGVF